MRKQKAARTPARSGRARQRKRPRGGDPGGTTDGALRELIARSLAWHDAHADFEQTIADLTIQQAGQKPAGLPYSAWQLLEHLRLAQRDILEFCRDPHYKERKWPDEYWPAADAPPDARAWQQSAAAYRRDLEELQRMAGDSRINLFARIPHGQGQTLLREIILVLDHNAYHLGQLVLVRRLIGAWK